MRQPRRWVKMFMHEFAERVGDGRKSTTIRPRPKRPQDMPQPGDFVDCRMWTGRPYRSAQRKIGRWEIVGVRPVTVWHGGILMGDPSPAGTMQPVSVPGLTLQALNRLAVRDGFADWPSMLSWFMGRYWLPFDGVLIEWDYSKAVDL